MAKTYNTLHGIDDRAKLAALTNDMLTNGWVGAPLVAWGDNDLITGTHRYHAAIAADLDNIPVVNLEDLYEEAGLDFEALWNDHGQPSYGDAEMVWLIHELPETIRAEYGVDIE